MYRPSSGRWCDGDVTIQLPGIEFHSNANFVTGIFLLTSLLFALGEAPGADVDHVVVYKHERRLVLLSEKGIEVVADCSRWRTQWAEDEARRPSNSRGAVRARFTERQPPRLQSFSRFVSNRKRCSGSAEIRRQSWR